MLTDVHPSYLGYIRIIFSVGFHYIHVYWSKAPHRAGIVSMHGASRSMMSFWAYILFGIGFHSSSKLTSHKIRYHGLPDCKWVVINKKPMVLTTRAQKSAFLKAQQFIDIINVAPQVLGFPKRALPSRWRLLYRLFLSQAIRERKNYGARPLE